MRFRFHSITSSLLFLAIFCINASFLHSAILGVILAIFYLVLYGRNWKESWILLSMIMLTGSVAYYLASVPAWLFLGLVFVTPIIRFGIDQKTQKNKPFKSFAERLASLRTSLSIPVLFANVVVLFLVILFTHILQNHQITDAVRTPWDVIPVPVLAIFFIATIITSALLYRGREPKRTIAVFSIVFGCVLTFIAFSYPIGYGFDSFIHKATESHLAQFGTITPKPFYYIGQYSLTLFFSHAFILPIDAVDTWLLPILASILLPLAWLSAAKTILKKTRYTFLPLFGLFLLPLDGFIVTTPQGVANLWILLSILVSVPWLFDEDQPNWRLAGLATASTFLIHPMAGIPLSFYFALLFLHTQSSDQDKPRSQVSVFFSRFALIVMTILGSLALPASFIVQSIKSGQGIHLTWSNLNPAHLLASMNLNVLWQSRFSPLIDFVYLYGKNIFLLAFLIGFSAWWIYRTDLAKHIRVIGLMILVLGINYLLLANVIDFSFLIDYERANYAQRLFPLMVFFLSPLLILAFGHLSINLRTRPMALKLTALFLLSAMATASFYLAFPRRDAYETSRAFNVSQADVDAVYLIDDWSKNEPYIVLANQSVSAAAIKYIGFHYFGNIFFYPIPTGEAMYQKFLEMNTAPIRKTIDEAISLLPKDETVHAVYYVVDTYWWQADRIIEQSKAIADDWKSVNGSVYVFRFDVK